MQESGYLYLMSDSETGYVKIGISNTDPRLKRTRQLNSGTKRPGEVTCIKAIKTRHYKRAEKILHRCYKEYRKKGEWFKLPQTEITALMLMTPSQVQQLIEVNIPINSIVSLMKGDILFYNGKKEYLDFIHESNERMIEEKNRELDLLRSQKKELEGQIAAIKFHYEMKEDPTASVVRAALSSIPQPLSGEEQPKGR